MKKISIFLKSNQILVQKIYDFLHQIRSLLSYLSLEKDKIKQNNVLKILRSIYIKIKDKNV